MCFKLFSNQYAAGVSAIADVALFLLGVLTLFIGYRDFKAKYRPYIFADVLAEINADGKTLFVSIRPKNVGLHPCRFKLEDIKLNIGDESYSTPSFEEWVLLATSETFGLDIPMGTVNEIGIKKIRDKTYAKNRIEALFTIRAASITGRFQEKTSYCYEINISGEIPQVLFRPDWIIEIKS